MPESLVWIWSVPKGSLPRPIGTIRDHWGPITDYWGLFGLIGLGRLPLVGSKSIYEKDRINMRISHSASKAPNKGDTRNHGLKDPCVSVVFRGGPVNQNVGLLKWLLSGIRFCCLWYLASRYTAMNGPIKSNRRT